MFDEYDYFEITPLIKDLLEVYIKHGFGDTKMYETTCFSVQLCDETACLTIEEFYEKSHLIGTK